MGMQIDEISKNVEYIIGKGDTKRQELMMAFIDRMMQSYEDITGKSTVEKIELDDDYFNNEFLVYVFQNTLYLSHYVCDTDMDLQLGDYDLDKINRTAVNHLKECKKEEQQ